MDWRCGSSGGAPALQVQSPEFKPQCHKKNKKANKQTKKKFAQGLDVVLRTNEFLDVCGRVAFFFLFSFFFEVLGLKRSDLCLLGRWSTT
jgi:hypothetical protein